MLRRTLSSRIKTFVEHQLDVGTFVTCNKVTDGIFAGINKLNKNYCFVLTKNGIVEKPISEIYNIGERLTTKESEEKIIRSILDNRNDIPSDLSSKLYSAVYNYDSKFTTPAIKLDDYKLSYVDFKILEIPGISRFLYYDPETQSSKIILGSVIADEIFAYKLTKVALGIGGMQYNTYEWGKSTVTTYSNFYTNQQEQLYNCAQYDSMYGNNEFAYVAPSGEVYYEKVKEFNINGEILYLGEYTRRSYCFLNIMYDMNSGIVYIEDMNTRKDHLKQVLLSNKDSINSVFLNSGEQQCQTRKTIRRSHYASS